MADSDYESVLCVKPEVHVYRIPPRASNRGYRAAEWQLDQPAWSGRLRITARGNIAFIKLEDRTTGELFAQATVEQFPGIAVESVTDSSRYFVICIEDGNGRRAFIGVGFADRGDAFDFNVALQDHFKWVKQQTEFAKQAQNPDTGPKLDLGFKEGQTIKINIAVRSNRRELRLFLSGETCHRNGGVIGERTCLRGEDAEGWKRGALTVGGGGIRWVKQQTEFAKQAQNPDTGPKLDLGFKEGQTIKINIAVRFHKLDSASGPPRLLGGDPLRSRRRDFSYH
ncbi:PREDICTED: adaptin ear-binding coat-associated protein 2 [Nanorana parkeri]|uniref:adaptin ear-binding coat-associated protein 2 n=1 Tax=Nanorana parkeri TaxID=125878 RepID=UPI000854B267|nr:PREDICTED: adaptin ear-binding coat-associated protein 2 [Nanorana parkeri]